MSKIAYIGAGSTTFAKKFIGDIVRKPKLSNLTLTLMDISEENLDMIANLAKKILNQQGGSSIKIEKTTDTLKALDGADYVIDTTNRFGFQIFLDEEQIVRKYGVHPFTGCTSGPMGVFKGLREIPPMLELCKQMKKVCPDTWYLHYINPTSIVPWALDKATSIKNVGICHSVQGTARKLANYIGVPFEETGHWVAGVNHQAWVLRFEVNGKDAYPLVFEKMEDPEIYKKDIVRFELMKFFGYFPTESSDHNSEYVPYFRKNKELIEKYVPNSETHHRDNMAERDSKWEKQKKEAYGNEPVVIGKESNEYCIGIINALENDEPYRFNGNVMNNGLISNLPNICCVEVPCLVDNMGIHPCYVGDLPPQCASLNRNRIAGDELAVKGALEGDRVAVEQAVALDPLTAAMCTLDQIRDMVKELFELEKKFLPQFK